MNDIFENPEADAEIPEAEAEIPAAETEIPDADGEIHDADAEIPEADANAEIHDADTEIHETTEKHERASALNEGDRRVIKAMNLDDDAVAALILLGTFDNDAKSRLLMKLLLKKKQLQNPSAFVTRAVWSTMKSGRKLGRARASI